MKIYCGIDWAEAHHDVAVIDDTGRRLAKTRTTDDLSGFTALCQVLADAVASAQSAEPVSGFVPVDVAIETDRGLLVAALRAAGHRVWSINPKAVDRYRDRYSSSRAKSDPGDALILANVLRTDAHAHRQLPADSHLAGAIGVLARTQQDLARRRRSEAQAVRSLLREFFPAALLAFPDLTTATAILILAAAPTPTSAAALTPDQLLVLLRQAGRGTLPKQAARLAQLFGAPQLRQPAEVEHAMGQALTALVAALRGTVEAVRHLEVALQTALEQHPHAALLDTLPGLGVVLASRLLAEFGDDPDRFAHAQGRRAYAGTAPVIRASGKVRAVVLRRGGNRRLVDTCRQWAYSAITGSPGARAHYDRRRAAGDRHEAALRNLANKLVGQLDHCLRHDSAYREADAWPSPLTPPITANAA